jgi:phosphoribosylamine---glycine ligase
MKILLVGSGGREHALALGLKADTSTTELHCAPGNPGIADLALLHPLDVTNNAAIVALAKELFIDLVVIGPEAALINGAADALRSAGFKVFGPSKAASQLADSKEFAEGVMRDAGVHLAAQESDSSQGEFSLSAMCDGRNVIPMQPTQNFQPNGMGAYSPLPWAPDDIVEDTYTQVLAPVIAEMTARGTPFIGLLTAHLAMSDDGIRVIELSICFGDSDTQVLIPLLKTPLATLLYNAATNNLDDVALQWREDSAVSVLLAAGGYPDSAQTGSVILNIPNVKETITFHAGTSRSTAGLVSSGGRVISVTGIGEDLTEARDRAYRAISQIALPGSFYRTDIALNASVAEKGN